ncbi:MAG: hypothetical protein RIC19_10545 [Phaeodactylibacter sp.]|uniref:glucosaminidase domain-containing protein n=1 Tax=Phaeodactylibacter sp. TaxID=1940289 RepID=UPI0032EEB4A0
MRPYSYFVLTTALLMQVGLWAAPYPQPVEEDHVQQALAALETAAPNLVGYIPETQRRYIKVPRSSALPDQWQERLQNAFYQDAAAACQLYGHLYLADWRALLAKAARESFWGTSFLANRTFNYFGIRHHGKPWICQQLGFCAHHVRDDPTPAAFVVFPNFEASAWAFMHTIYSGHFLVRLPDGGIQVADAIQFEREHGIHYWDYTARGQTYAAILNGVPYSAQSLIYSWSGHPINNLCINCDRASDWEWVQKIIRIEERTLTTPAAFNN